MTDAKPLLSTIVPVFNGEPFLAEALNSIFSQECENMEIIVVDDGSTDGSANVARAYGDRVNYHYQANSGPSAARNSGLRRARGSLITFLDADDLWPPGKLSRALALLAGDPAVDAVIGRTRFLKLRDGSSDSGDFEEILVPRVFLQLGSAVFRRVVFDRIGLFNAELQFSEDVDWFSASPRTGYCDENCG